MQVLKKVSFLTIIDLLRVASTYYAISLKGHSSGRESMTNTEASEPEFDEPMMDRNEDGLSNQRGGGFFKYIYAYFIMAYVIVGGAWAIELYSVHKQVESFKRMGDDIDKKGFLAGQGFMKGTIRRFVDAKNGSDALVKKEIMLSTTVTKKVILAPLYCPMLFAKGTNMFYEDFFREVDI